MCIILFIININNEFSIPEELEEEEEEENNTTDLLFIDTQNKQTIPENPRFVSNQIKYMIIYIN